MPQHASATRICKNCDGFASVAITTGARNRDGSRATLRVTCSACKGTGHTAPAPALARSGR